MAAKKPKSAVNTGLVADNRRVRFDYEILDTLEAGIVLTGTEVKSLRTGKAQNPSIRVLKALSEFFGVPMSYFLEDTSEEEIDCAVGLLLAAWEAVCR